MIAGRIRVQGLGKRFGGVEVLSDLTLDLPAGEVTVLMGPSGSGKTTLAHILLGLLRPDTGAVSGLAGRRASAVFQEDRLCEHLGAVANVRLVLDREVDAATVRAELARVGLDADASDRPVSELSGGQRRRVALVRAMLADSDFVCLDEPFTALDDEARALATAYVRDRRRGRTLLLITHDPRDAEEFGGGTQLRNGA